MNAVTTVDIAGGPRERGRTHGRALADRLRAFLDDGLARLDHLTDRSIDLDSVRGTVEAHRDAVAEALPDLAEEVDGLAEGAGIDRDEAWLLQLRREILGYSRVTAGDCTTYASVRGRPVLAQTVDLNGGLDDQIAVLAVSGPRHRSLVLSFAGLLGYLGVNDAGVAVGLNLVIGGTWRPGVPPYLAIRHALDTADDVDHAVAILCGLDLASSRSFTVCGGGRAVCVEALGEERRLIEGPELVHANHFLHADLTARDEINVFAKNSSKRRLDAVLAAGIPDADDVAAHHRLLSGRPINVPDNGDLRRERTVAAVVLRPDTGRLRLWPGDPATAKEHVWTLE
ncbi:C45 family autoproteolytic acyltransferase/hydolase [Glycomyces harbinensis]|uniref:Acyl-coenzyme A:6-aminopenicillanic acid acyl-transferase n=1 Tax=Glycomyces harbinensis TaxID=58114 RepID=A0A1G6ZM44_9ACTN|nr:C45 family peptidase [Glycomyces harbinensis]SDE02646.1 Acyl-coenzyme A:6-aminopenicillanic acid acyl-transferase [Glycomyces harbinensis]